jgi:hypothetical protein
MMKRKDASVAQKSWRQKFSSPKSPLSKREQKVRKEIPACNNKSGHAFREIKVLLHFFGHPPNNY